MDGLLYQSLVAYGRQIFQLCLGTVLTGADLSTSAGLEEKFVTNQERFEKICAILKDKTIPGRERLERIRPLVDATQQYRYVPETGLQIKTMIGAARLAAEILLKSGEDISRELSQHLKQLSTAEPSERITFRSLRHYMGSMMPSPTAPHGDRVAARRVGIS